MEYASPGDAFSSSIANTLQLRDQQARQMQDDALKQQAEARMQRAQQAQMDEAQAALAEKRQEHQEAIDQKESDRTLKEVVNSVPGDIFNSDTWARIQKYHIPVRMTAPVPAPQEPPPQAPAPPTALAEDPTAPSPVNGPAGTGVLTDKPSVYAGSKQDVDKKKLEDKVNEIRDTLSGTEPGTPEYNKAIIDYEMVTGKSVPAGLAKAGAGSGTGNVARVSPDKSKIEVMRGGKWTTATETDLGPGTHWLAEPPPKDQGPAEARKASAATHAYDTGVKDLDKFEAPIQGHLDGVSGLKTALAQRTPTADALVAPLILKATVAGQGSGFRMTRGEIDNVMHSRSAWQDLEAKLQHWDTDHSKALQLTEEQRTDMRNLAKAIEVKANKQMDVIAKTRDAIDDAYEAGDSATIHRLRTQLRKDLKAANADSDTQVDDTSLASRADALLKR